MVDTETYLRQSQKRERRRQQKQDRFRGYNDAQLESYFDAVHKVYEAVMRTNVDAILIPLRGAEPFMRAIRLFASLEKKSSQLPRFYTIKIGARVESGKKSLFAKGIPRDSGKYLPSISYAEQAKIIKATLARITKKSGKGNLRLLLLDEVQMGGSITKQQDLITRAARELDLKLDLKTFAVAECGKQKSASFKERVSQGRIKVFAASRLIPCDSFKFLIQQIQTAHGERLGISKYATAHRLNLLTNLQKRFERRRRI